MLCQQPTHCLEMLRVLSMDHPRLRSLWTWLNQPSNTFPGCWVDDIPSHHLRISIVEASEAPLERILEDCGTFNGLAYHTNSTEDHPFLVASGETPEEAAQKLEKRLLERYPDLQAIFSPEEPKTALERILNEKSNDIPSTGIRTPTCLKKIE